MSAWIAHLDLDICVPSSCSNSEWIETAAGEIKFSGLVADSRILQLSDWAVLTRSEVKLRPSLKSVSLFLPTSISPSSTLTSFPAHTNENHLHNLMLPPPCFTLRTMFAVWLTKRSILIPSNHFCLPLRSILGNLMWLSPRRCSINPSFPVNIISCLSSGSPAPTESPWTSCLLLWLILSLIRHWLLLDSFL